MNKITLNDLYNMGDVLYGAIEQVRSEIPDVPSDYQELADEVTGMQTDITDLKTATSQIPTGIYPDMAVGEVFSDDSYTEDQTPYLYRVSGGGVEVGKIEADTIVGGTVAWNQHVRTVVDSTEYRGITFTNNNYGSLTISGTYASDSVGHPAIVPSTDNIPWKTSHKYLIDLGVNEFPVSLRATSNITFIGWINGRGRGIVYPSTDVNGGLVLRLNGGSGVAFDNITIKPMVFDLTQMFGSAVADMIYNMETANAGSGVTFFKNLGFNASYYPYNAGELLSVSGLQSHDMTGFNQWDEDWEVGTIGTNGLNQTDTARIRTKGYIRVLPNTDYYIKCPTAFRAFRYDENKNFINYTGGTNGIVNTGEGCHYLRFRLDTTYGTVYKDDICVNLSSDRNGEYEPYEKHSYPLDSSLTLRGIPKLDASNNLYYDGDVYTADGKVQRKYGFRAYQSGDESLTDAITDGTNTVYKLSTPTEESAQAYTEYQKVSKYGTEEYVSTGIVPVGHVTKYPADIVSKVDGLPSDFSTLIAPTETAMKATRAYTVNQFLIVNNQLYRVTAAIASGATITPNTNVTAVTVADILTSLLNA